jgi:hypothetical protein
VDADGAIGYYDLCLRLGIDPAKDIEDDFIAWQVRIGLDARWQRERNKQPEQTPEEQFAKGRAAIEAARKQGA